jgi:hypothetical protein
LDTRSYLGLSIRRAIKLEFRTSDPKACWQSCTRSELRPSSTRLERNASYRLNFNLAS